MARLSREENREQTRTRLLDAARIGFARLGYAGASVDLIAESAGFSKGALYSNFASKEDLFLLLLKQHLEAEVASSAEVIADADFETALDRFVDRYAVDREDQDWCLLSVEFALHAARSEEFGRHYAALYEGHYRSVADILEKLAARAGGRVGDCGQSAAKFIAFRRGLALDRGSQRPSLSESDVKDALTAFLLKVLAFDPDAPPSGHGI